MDYRKSRRRLISLAVAALTLSMGLASVKTAQAADEALVSAAESEGELAVYGDPFVVPLLLKNFSAKYPKIRVTSATGDGWQIYNRFVSENNSGRPLMDVMYQAEDTVITAQQAGFLADFKTIDGANLSKLATPVGGSYVRGNGNLILFAFNREALGAVAKPADWTDFVNPPAEWEGLIATTNPASSSATFAAIASIYQKFGAEKGGEILRGLRKTKAELNPSMGVMATKLQTGERPLDFFNITTAVSGVLAKGAPVDLVVPASGAVAQFNAIGVNKNAPHPNAARLLAEFALSQDMQAAFAEAGVYPMRVGIASPKGLPDITSTKLIELDLPAALKQRDAILDWWSENTGFKYR